MTDSQDVDTLRRRGRRRLIGAIALVLLAVIVLPMVFDQEPKSTAPAVNIRIPREDAGAFVPKLAPKPEAPAPSAEDKAKAGEGRPQEGNKAGAAPGPSEEKRDAAAATKAPTASAAAERARAEAALANIEFVVPVAALASPEGLKDLTGKLAAAKLPHYTEPVATASGTVTRVRAGPFVSREAAERARDRLKRLGLNPGNVTQRSE